MTIQASDLTFGIEIECYIDTAVLTQNRVLVGGYHHGIQVDALPQGWKAERDGSIRTPSGKTAVEIVSPILMGADGIRQVELVLQWLRDMGAGCNSSCGIHVHVGANELVAKRLVGLVAQHEKALFALSGGNGKTRVHNDYCRGVQGNSQIEQSYKSGDKNLLRVAGNNRYHTLNLNNLISGRRPAVEFRAFASTFRTEVVLGYIRVSLGLVQVANVLKRNVKFASNWHSPTETGHEHVRCLMERLKWGMAGSTSACRTKDGVDFGWIESTAQNDVKSARKALLATAKDFDVAMAC